MFWPFLFVLCIAQGLFLILVFSLRKNKNPLAARILTALLLLFALANFDDLLLSTGWYKSVPALFGYATSALLAYGPLLWLYALATTDPAFSWRRKTWWHFAPFLAGTALQMPFILLSPAAKTKFLDTLLSGRFPANFYGMTLFGIQLAHLTYYWYRTARLLRSGTPDRPEPAFQVPLARRRRWLALLTGLFALFVLCTLALFAATAARGYYLPRLNFAYTLAGTAIAYAVSARLALHPESVAPDFSRRYGKTQPDARVEQACLQQLKALLEEEKIFTQPELSLPALSARLGVTPHQLSRLIHENFDLSFRDLINRYRVEAFIARRNDPRYAHYSLLGLAYDVGFSSKSAFNAAFKKTTGQTPSAYKKS